jgi:hypothetical protein
MSVCGRQAGDRDLGIWVRFQWARFSRPATIGHIRHGQTFRGPVGAQCHSSDVEKEMQNDSLTDIDAHEQHG